MLHLSSVSLSRLPQHKPKPCTQGILDKNGIRQCSWTSGEFPRPFVLLKVEEREGTNVIRSGWNMYFGQQLKHDIEPTWRLNLQSLIEYINIGRTNLEWIVKYSFAPRGKEKFFNLGEDEYLKKMETYGISLPSVGKLFTKAIEPDFDFDGDWIEECTCYVMYPDCNDEKKVRDQFKYQGKKLLDVNGKVIEY